MRVFNYYNWSLSNDELSAITRTGYSSFSEMIAKGARIDGHPVGVETFLFYWIKLFGESEMSVRFPFVIAGIGAILFTYLIAERWFNRTTGLFVAITFSCLQFPILYSQLARPYSPGLLFSLSMVYFWTLILFPSKQKRSKSFTDSKTNVAGFVFSASACMYTHYFAFMFAGIVGLTGLLFLNKSNSRGYIISSVLIILLYIPHVGIFLQQMSYGGVGSWLSKPTATFFRSYIEYSFNSSDAVFYMLWAICIFSFIIFRHTLELSKFHVITLLWFLLPFVIGYYYSVHINPVLQYSTLLFSFPFLLIFIFSFIPDVLDDIKTILLILIVGSVITVSTIFGNNFYSTQYFAVFKELAQDVIKWNEQYGEKNITRTINVFHPNYIQYYFRKFDKKADFALYEINDPLLISKLKTVVDTASTQYFVYGWSNINHDPVINEIIRNKFPNIVERDSFFNSEITLFSRKSSGESERTTIYQKTYDFEEIKPVGKDSMLVSEDFAHSGTHSIKLDNNTEYSPGITETLGAISSTAGIVNASVWVYLPDTNTIASMVITFEANGKATDWYSVPLKDYTHQPNKWAQIVGSKSIPNGSAANDLMKVYIWNQDKKTLYFDDLEVKVFKK